MKSLKVPGTILTAFSSFGVFVRGLLHYEKKVEAGQLYVDYNIENAFVRDLSSLRSLLMCHRTRFRTRASLVVVRRS